MNCSQISMSPNDHTHLYRPPSWEKVMFSLACVCSRWGGGGVVWVCVISWPFQREIYQWVGIPRGVYTKGTGIPKVVLGCGYVYPPPRPGTWNTHAPILTPSGSHHNTNIWQVGGTHPTGMFSCWILS